MSPTSGLLPHGASAPWGAQQIGSNVAAHALIVASCFVVLALAYLAFRLRRTEPFLELFAVLGIVRIDEREAAEAVRRWAVVFRHSSWGVVVTDADGLRIEIGRAHV